MFGNQNFLIEDTTPVSEPVSILLMGCTPDERNLGGVEQLMYSLVIS